MKLFRVSRYAIPSLLACSFFADVSTATAGNIGHRIGAGRGEFHSDLPENSLTALRAALLGRDGKDAIQNRSDFHYMELDVRETWDGDLAVMHDSTPKRTMKNKAYNKEAIAAIVADPDVKAQFNGRTPSYSSLQISKLKMDHLRTLRYGDKWDDGVPSLADIFEGSRTMELRKPVAIEIKLILTDAGRQSYIDQLRAFSRRLHGKGRY